LDGWESIRRVQQLRRRIRKAKSSLSQTRQDLISLQYRAADAARSKKPNTEEFQETLGLREGVKSIAELSTEVATAEGDIENMMNDLTEALKNCEKPYTPLLVSKYLKRYVRRHTPTQP
jgi:seryl-tRNA synthetase